VKELQRFRQFLNENKFENKLRTDSPGFYREMDDSKNDIANSFVTYIKHELDGGAKTGVLKPIADKWFYELVGYMMGKGNEAVVTAGKGGSPSLKLILDPKSQDIVWRKFHSWRLVKENLAGMKAGKFNEDDRYETLYVFSPSKIEDITYGEDDLDFDEIDLPSGKFTAILWHNSDLQVYAANSKEELVQELEEDFFDEGEFGDFEGLKEAANNSEPDGDSNHGIALFVDGKLIAGPQGGVEIYK